MAFSEKLAGRVRVMLAAEQKKLEEILTCRKENWTSELTLIGWDKIQQFYLPLITLQYGFSLSAGSNSNQLLITNLNVIEPSASQLNLIRVAQLMKSNHYLYNMKYAV